MSAAPGRPKQARTGAEGEGTLMSVTPKHGGARPMTDHRNFGFLRRSD